MCGSVRRTVASRTSSSNVYALAQAQGEWRIIAERQWFDPIPDPVDEPRPEPDPERHAKIAAAIVDIEREPDDYWKLLGIFSDQAPDKAELEWVAQRLKQTATDPATDASRLERLRSSFRRDKS